MKKRKLISMLLLPAIALSCAAACEKNEETLKSESGVSTTLVTTKAPDELTPENAIYAFLQKQSELKSYKITTEGTAVANIAGYKQEIKSIAYKNGDDYLNQAESDSFLVKLKHQAFSKGGKVVYRNSFDGEMQVAEKEEYKKVYGFTADEVTLGGFIINSKTLRYAALEKAEGDAFTYYFRLAGDQSKAEGSAVESASSALRVQAKAFGSLENYPAFSDIDVRLTFKKDWTPVSYSSVCTYDCKKVFEMNVRQEIVSTYSEVNGNVQIPDVAAFNQKVGSTPSTITPQKEEGDLIKLLTAVGNSLGEKNELLVPVSLKLTAYRLQAEGNLSLTLSERALESDDLLNAFSLNVRLDLSSIPLLSGIANTLTVRYAEGGLFLFTLQNESDGTFQNVYSFPLDLKEELRGIETVSLEEMQNLFETYFDFEKTESGFKISAKPFLAEKWSASFDEMLSSLSETLHDQKGYLRSLLGMKISGLSIELSTMEKDGKETLSSASAVLFSELIENETAGEKLEVSLDIGLLSSSGMLSGAFEGDLDFRINPAVVWTGDFLAIAEAHLNLDLTPVSQILGMVGMFAPAGSLPPFVSSDLNNLDLYYTGDGVLTLALNNEEGRPLFATQIDLAADRLPSASETASEGAPEDFSGSTASLFSEFRLEKTANGMIFALGDSIVKLIDEAYQQLIEKAVEFVVASAGEMGEFAGPLVKNMIGATITNLEFFLGTNEEGKTTFRFAIKGVPVYDMFEDYSERALLTFSLTDQGPLTAEEQAALSAGRDKAEKLLENSVKDKETAAAFAERLQPYIDRIVLTAEEREAYIKGVDALKAEFDELPANVQALIPNASFMEDTDYSGQTYSKLHVIYEMYLARATAFQDLLPENDDYMEFETWDEINGLYDKADTSHQWDLGITVPAVKDSDEMKAAVGEDRITAYERARGAHEDKMVQALNEKIAASKEKFKNATGREELLEALKEIVEEIKPSYTSLPAEKQALVEGFMPYLTDVYFKNLDKLSEEYERIKSEIEKLLKDKENKSIENLYKIMKELSSAYAWGFGYDYWEYNTNTAATGCGSWITTLKPQGIGEEQQKRINDFNTLNRELIKGDTAKKIATEYKDVIKAAVEKLKGKISDCKKVEEGKTVCDFSKFNAEEKKELLETLHALRYMISKVLPGEETNAIWGDDEELKTFASSLWSGFEKPLMDEPASKKD